MEAFKKLNPREKFLLCIGLPIILALVVYYYFWIPSNHRLSQLRNEIPLKTAELAWMRYEFSLADSWIGNSTSKSLSGQPILTVIEATSTAANIKKSIQRVQPNGVGEVKVWFQDVNADGWLTFVHALVPHGISVESATITRKSEGIVNVRVTFIR